MVRRIPRGRVVTYGTIARLVGCPAHARRVGRTLAPGHATPRCRATASSHATGAPLRDGPNSGRCSKAEGVTFGRVPLRRYAWPLPEE